MNLIIIWYPPKIAFCFSWCCWVFFSFSYQLLHMFYFSQFPRVLFSLLCCFSVNAFMEEVALHCFQGKVGVGAIVFVVQGGKIGFWIFIFVNTTQEKTSNINSGILRFFNMPRSGKKDKDFFSSNLVFFLNFWSNFFRQYALCIVAERFLLHFFFSHFPGNT